MTQSDTTGHDLWLQFTCLLMSLLLHAGLGSLVRQGFEPATADSAPILVALVERPAPLAGGSAEVLRTGPPAAAPSRAGARPASAAPAATPAKPPLTSAQPVPPAAAVPQAATVTEPVAVAPLPAGEPAPAADDAGRGAGLSTGEAALDGGGGPGQNGEGYGGSGGGGRSGSSGGNLVKATPRYESNPPPPYPRLARQNHWEGTVRLRARVSASGEIDSVTLERSSGHEVLDRSALDGVKRWRFIPATRGGVPVPCEVSIPVAFRLTE